MERKEAKRSKRRERGRMRKRKRKQRWRERKKKEEEERKTAGVERRESWEVEEEEDTLASCAQAEKCPKSAATWRSLGDNLKRWRLQNWGQ